MKMVKRVGMVGAVVIVVGATVAGCKSAKMGPEEVGGHIMDFMSRRLELDDTQRAKLEAVRDEIRRVRQETQSERKALATAWMDEIRKEEMDPQRMMELMKQRHALKERNAPQVLDDVVTFHQSLTPEQRERIATRIGEMRDWANSATDAQ